MTVTATRATQRSRSTVELAWLEDDPPVAGYQIDRIVNNSIWIPFGTINGELASFIDSSLEALTIGDVLGYRIQDLDTLATTEFPEVTVNDPDVPFTYAPPDPEASTPRYTDLETVKRRLRIDAANTTFDDDLTEAIVACEISIEYELGQSFPSAGTNPQYGTVPYSIRSLATNAAIAVYKAADTPFGVAGSDDYFGALSVADVAAQTIRRSPLLRGLQRSFGVS